MYGSYLLSFSVKVKGYSAKFQQTIAKILPLNISFFFRHEIFFFKSTFKGPGKKLGQFFKSKKGCILIYGKEG